MPSLPRLEPAQSRQDCLAGPAGLIEYKLEMPAHPPRAVALICHPHPLYQGSMDNKVVYTLSRIAMSQGCVALRFQFRGVGRSEGVHDHGQGEAQDAAFLLEQLRASWPGLPAVMMGFSFGAYMALKVAAEHADVAGLLTIAPPLSYAGSASPPQPQCPWLLIHGDADDVVACDDTVRRASTLSPPPRIELVPGAGHFFHGQLASLRGMAEPWLDAVINEPRAAVE